MTDILTESNTLTIPRTLANRLLSLAQTTPEAEVCGLISQYGKNKYRVYPIENSADNKNNAFEMQPQQQLNAFKSMREQQESLFAIFHSHPHSEAQPSLKDLKEAAYDNVLNIIISLNTRGVLDMRGFYYKNNNYEVVDLNID